MNDDSIFTRSKSTPNDADTPVTQTGKALSSDDLPQDISVSPTKDGNQHAATEAVTAIRRDNDSKPLTEPPGTEPASEATTKVANKEEGRGDPTAQRPKTRSPVLLRLVIYLALVASAAAVASWSLQALSDSTASFASEPKP